MQLFNSVVRKYTPPTCTLEVKARESPLSRWVPLKVLKQLTFELYIDDPKHQQAPQVSLWGDGEELEMLQEAVSVYVQDLIDKSHNQLEVALGQPASQSSSPQLRPNEKNNHHLKALPSSEANLARLAPAEEALEEIESEYPPEPSQPRLMLAASPYLKPRGLLAHDLVLGPLETDESGPIISLSVLQLFDLATALDEYAADVVVMPSLSSQPLSFRNRPIWIYAAAGGIVAAVGLTLALGQMFSRSKQPQTVVMSPTQQPTLNEDAPLAGDSLPPPVSPTPLASLSPGATPLLPPAPGATALNPNLPNSAGVPAPSNSASLPTSPGLGQPPLGNPQISSSSVPFNPPNSSFQQPSSNNTRPSFSIPSFNSSPPIKVVTPSKPASAPKTASRPPLRIVTPPQPKISASRPPLRIVTPPQPQIASIPQTRVTAKAPAPPSSSQLKPGRSTGTAGLPKLNPSPVTPPVAFNADPFPQALPEVAPSISSNSSNLSPNADNSASSADKTRIFDSIPQVAEARNYFQQRWKPPQGLTQSLQYSLVVGSDGSIERIIPLTEAAKLYIDRTNIPLPGGQFVSPLTGKTNAQIRVVLNADGKVETLLE
ncbi:MAG TPA: DUF4335 domain-containing protein [Oculatellaceae cyanobacterium]|jgi:hypothetical protein